MKDKGISNGNKKSSKVTKGIAGAAIGIVLGHSLYVRSNPSNLELQYNLAAIARKYEISDLDIKISFRELDNHNSVIARAYPLLNVIEVDPVHWRFMSEEEREFTLLHELAHLKYIEHDNRRPDDICPASVMHSHSSPFCFDNRYLQYQTQFIEEVLPQITHNENILAAKIRRAYVRVLDFLIGLAKLL
jgi:hypothetical protein